LCEDGLEFLPSQTNLTALLVEIAESEALAVTHKLLRNGMKETRENFDALEKILQIFSCVAWESPDAAAVLIAQGALDMVVDVMTRVPIPALYTAALLLIAQLALHISALSSFVKKGVIPCVENALRRGKEHRQSTENACVCISRWRLTPNACICRIVCIHWLCQCYTVF
jgi:hypothetical protein